MAIQKANTPDWSKLGADEAWPTYDEDGYVSAANAQMENARKATQAGETMAVQASGVIDSNMQGATSEAATATFMARGGKLEGRGVVHASNAAVNGLMAQNVANTKAQVNAVAAEHEAEVEALKVRAVATQMTQNEVVQEYDTLVDQNRQRVAAIAQNSESTHDGLKGQLNAGEPPTVPASMPGPPPGESAPSLDGLDPEVQSAVGGLMGSGGGMDPSMMMGMAQGMLSPLAQSLSSPPGMDMANQAGQQGLQALQTLLGQAGGGQAELTPDQVEELIAGQGGDSTDGLPGGEEPGGGDGPPEEDAPKFENPDPPSEDGTSPTAESDTASADTDTAADTEPASVEPSPAAEPVSAAPPPTAMPPTTELSGSSGTAAPATSAPGTTHLTGASTGSVGGSTLGAPGMGGGAMGAGGAGMMGGAPMMGAPMASGAAAQGAPARGAALASTPTLEQRMATPLSAPVTDPRAENTGTTAPTPAPAAVVPVTAGASRVADRHAEQVRRVMAHLLGEYRRVGLAGDLAIGAMTDGTLVYCTWDGLGFIPHGVLLPANVVPLSEFPLSPPFRKDFAAHSPGALIAVAIIPISDDDRVRVHHGSRDEICISSFKDRGRQLLRRTHHGCAAVPVAGGIE